MFGLRFTTAHVFVKTAGGAVPSGLRFRLYGDSGSYKGGVWADMRITRHLAAIVVGILVPLAAAYAGAGGVPVPELVSVPAGAYIAGSDRAEREAAYRLDEVAYGHSVTRSQRWYESEFPRGPRRTGAYAISRTPVTNAQYAAFIAATGYPWPAVTEAEWAGYGLVPSYARTRRYAWTGPKPPARRQDHPVVLVSHEDARTYAAWLSRKTGRLWRLPTEEEWEKAARGIDGRRFPWGEDFDPARANTSDGGPVDTTPVGAFPGGASPFGMLDAAGQVFEWTATRTGTGNGSGDPVRYVVKGGSWDDKGCGVCRPAARHGRPEFLKHILVGFRLVREGK